MTVLLNLLLNILLIGSMVIFLCCGAVAVFKAGSREERMIRGFAVFAGALVVLGSEAAGLTFAQFTVNALSGTGTTGAEAKAVGVILPGIAGVGIGHYLVTQLSESSNIAIRIMAFIGMLATVEFIEIYITGVQRAGLAVGAASIPNISFVVGVILYIVLKYDPENPAIKPGLRSARDLLRSGRAAHRATPSETASGPAGGNRNMPPQVDFPNFFGDTR